MMIRLVQSRDFEPIAALTNHFIRETTVHFGTQPVSAAELQDAWEQAKHRYPWIVGEVDGRFAGLARLYTWRERDAYRWTPESSIYVALDQHRRGVGRALYESLIETATAQGYRSLVAGITLPNDPSVALHEAMGFERVGQVQDAGFKFGAWHPVVFYQRRLRTDAQQASAIRTPEEVFKPRDAAPGDDDSPRNS